MGEEMTLNNSIERLMSFWNQQNIVSLGSSSRQLQEWENRHKIKMPVDFITLYLKTNAMETQYPNQTDNEGFLFYPLENVTSFLKEFHGKKFPSTIDPDEQCLIFMNYLQKSWWYGITFSADNPDRYSIVIIPDETRYKILTTSLSEFIDLYIQNAPVLYSYE